MISFLSNSLFQTELVLPEQDNQIILEALGEEEDIECLDGFEVVHLAEHQEDETVLNAGISIINTEVADRNFLLPNEEAQLCTYIRDMEYHPATILLQQKKREEFVVKALEQCQSMKDLYVVVDWAAHIDELMNEMVPEVFSREFDTFGKLRWSFFNAEERIRRAERIAGEKKARAFYLRTLEFTRIKEVIA